MSALRTAVSALQQRIAAAAQRVGRDPEAITVIAVTKGQPTARILEAWEAGLRDFGENRVQEALIKQRELEEQASSAQQPRYPIAWHLLGPLQRNKAKKAAAHFDGIHSLSDTALIDDLERHRRSWTEQGPDIGATAPLQAFIQVNISGESTKSGCRPLEAGAMLQHLQHCKFLRPVGLMTIAPWADRPERVRPVFAKLRHLRDNLAQQTGLNLKLSMGMSGDFEVAIEEGADYIRIGTALFGPRPA
jgi:pyridoxal phosphate enzyme (YggS family)